MESVSERLINNEKNNLSEYAMLCMNSRGREHPEDKDELRTPFQRDRDKILHCKSFRRLKQKTQVFISPEGDHYRTRMTHTLEVTQIARTISRALSLNEDLTEAIGMGHDLGHTPFGHEGERVLNILVPGGFTHFEQGERVVRFLEKDLKGLNLTYEVIDGIRNHTRGPWPSTLEGKVVRYADRIAYINHDIEDAISARIFSENDIPKEISDVLGHSKSQRITTLIKAIVYSSGSDIAMDPEIEKYFLQLHDFMFETVYVDQRAKGEEKKVFGLLEKLYDYYLKNTDRMPDIYQIIAEKEGRERAVCDYIQGMSDDYAQRTFTNLFIPKAWALNN